QAVAVRLGVGELQRVVRGEVAEMLGPLAIIEQRAQPIRGADAEMMRALGADLLALVEILVVDDLRAAGTLDHQALGNPARLLAGRLDGLAGLLEPGHQGEFITSLARNSGCPGSWS